MLEKLQRQLEEAKSLLQKKAEMGAADSTIDKRAKQLAEEAFSETERLALMNDCRLRGARPSVLLEARNLWEEIVRILREVHKN